MPYDQRLSNLLDVVLLLVAVVADLEASSPRRWHDDHVVYSGPTAEDLAMIPEALQARPQWVLWRGADRIDKHTGEVKLNKIPIDAQTLTKASSTDAETWHSLRQCLAALPCALEALGGGGPRDLSR